MKQSMHTLVGNYSALFTTQIQQVTGEGLDILYGNNLAVTAPWGYVNILGNFKHFYIWDLLRQENPVFFLFVLFLGFVFLERGGSF